MRKKALLALALAVLTLSAAQAEVYTGRTVAGRTETVSASSGGTVRTLNVSAGDKVTEGELIAATAVNEVFAGEDGTVAAVYAEAGDEMKGGCVVEVRPTEKYTIYCTVDDETYETPETMLMHIGETVYVKCTTNGTHRAIGIVTTIEGSEYHIETIGGELYLGETVYLYRDEDFSTKQKVGIGTVITTDTSRYTTEGRVLNINVEAGDTVEKGQLLYTWAEDRNEVTATCDGIVTEVSVSKGDRVEKDAPILTIMPETALRIEFTVPEQDLTEIAAGDTVRFVLPYDETETEYTSTIEHISALAEDGSYTVRVRPDDTDLKLGMNVEVHTCED